MSENAAVLPSRVWLTLFLEGGHKESLSIDPQHPLLDTLMMVLTNSAQKPALFDIPLREGSVLLTIPSHRIVGMTTEPPLHLKLNAPPKPPLPVVTPSSVAAPGVLANGQPEGITPCKVVQVGNVLTPQQHSALLELVRNRQKDFGGTSTTTNAIDWRKSVLIQDFSPFDELIRGRVRHLLPKVIKALGMEDFPIGPIESQLTAHNDGNFYKVHNDNGSVELAFRRITYVYYFNQSPKGFTGGDLRVFDRLVKGEYRTAAETYKTIEPMDNTIVFFDSGEMHEVCPVTCPSKEFMDSRFTINGWVRIDETPKATST